MITVAELLERKRILLERLEREPGPHECKQIERLLMQIDAALDVLDEPAKE
jgi:hypothetical protein